MKENEKVINAVLRSCLSGYSIYEDDIIDCISKDNRAMLRSLTRKDWLRLLCDTITMAYHVGQDAGIQQATEYSKPDIGTLAGRDLYRKIKSLSQRELSDLLFNIYKETHDTGAYDENAAPKYDYEKMKTELLKIHGVGSTKTDSIIEVVKKCLE